jgi:GntR family transcriptional regulator
MPPTTAKPAPVREALRALVLGLSPGERLPSERALAQDWGVARMTVRQAIAALAREGLVRTVHGSGSIREPAPIPLRVGLGSFAEAVLRHGMRPSTQLLERVEDADPPAAVREFLALAPGQVALRVRRLRLGDEVPLALERTWLPRTLVPELDDDAAAGSLYDHLARHGLLPDSGEESVRADLPDEQEARLLGMSVSRPVLRLTRRSMHRSQRVEYAEAVFPSDRYELVFALDDQRYQPPN